MGDIDVTIGGNAGQLQSAISQGIEAFTALRDAMAAVQQAAADMDAAGSAALEALGAASDGADKYTASLGELRGMLADATAAQTEFEGASTRTAESTNLFGSAVDGAAGKLRGFVTQAASMMTALVGMQLFNDAAGAVKNFADALFELNKQTEQNTYSWRYTYGVGMDPTAAMANAQDISRWTQKYSMSIPFTRQDLMTSISGAAPLGLDLEGLKQYMPVFADLASTHINPMTGQPLDLGTTVQAIKGAEMGYTRMLKYELNINPQELANYGLAMDSNDHITDMTTLLPALERYSEAQGWTQWQGGKTNPITGFNTGGTDVGAAKTTATATFWGAWSSWLDRLQNFELAGGAGLFGQLKTDLNGISDWWDAHQDQLDKFASLFSDTLGSGVHDVTIAFQGFADGLTQSGVGSTATDWLTNLGDWFNDPQHQQALQNIGQWFGENLPPAVKKFSDALDTLNTSWTTLAGNLGSQGNTSIFQGVIDAISFIPAQIGRDIQVWADVIAFLRDAKNGNWDAAYADAQLFAVDFANMASLGATGTTLPGAGASTAGSPADPTKYPGPAPHPGASPYWPGYAPGSGGVAATDVQQGGYAGPGGAASAPSTDIWSQGGVPASGLNSWIIPSGSGQFAHEIAQGVASGIALSRTQGSGGIGGLDTWHVQIALQNQVQQQIIPQLQQAVQQTLGQVAQHVAGSSASFGVYGTSGMGRMW